ncbi:MAG: hypothetical protein ACI83D_000207 [Planctomycetota bacterium]|jgi:hypothetical protein
MDAFTHNGLFYFVIQSGIVWLPIALLILLWKLWIFYIQQLWISKRDWRMLHIRIPSTMLRSPISMEIILGAMYQTGGVAEWHKRWWEGRVRAWHSLEIVSIEGNVYFFIRTESRFVNIISSAIYSQYPQAEVMQVDDYTRHIEVYTRQNDWGIFGIDWRLKKPDAYPIKTYVDWGLDKAVGVDEEEKIDPLAQMIEYMGTIGPGEQIWTQILITPGINRNRVPGTWFKYDSWQDEAKRELDSLIAKYSQEDKDGNLVFNYTRLRTSEKDTIEGIERSLNKQGFDAGFRTMYLAKGKNFDGNHIAGLLTMTKQFGVEGLNSFAIAGTTSNDFAYEDFAEVGLERRKKNFFDAFVRRAYFYHPYKKQPFVLTTEELATLFHFPGRVSETPGFGRIDSRKSEPPSNLPI